MMRPPPISGLRRWRAIRDGLEPNTRGRWVLAGGPDDPAYADVDIDTDPVDTGAAPTPPTEKLEVAE